MQKLTKMKPKKIYKIKEKKKCVIQWVNYIMKGLKVVMVNIVNNVMLNKIGAVKNSSLKTEVWRLWLRWMVYRRRVW